MTTTLKYYLGNLSTSDELSLQAKALREILFSDKDNALLFSDVTHFIAEQKEIFSDTINLLNIAIVPSYGAEYLGLPGSDWNMKTAFFKSIIIQFPNEVSFKFKFADCACMAGLPVQIFYPILEEGMLLDKENKYYPSTELFEAIQESEFNFQFDLLLLDKYYQPCSAIEFEDYLNDFKQQYKTSTQIEQLNKLQWKGKNINTN